MRIGIWGAGAEGLSAARVLRNDDTDVLVIDEGANPRPAELDERVSFSGGPGALEQLLDRDLVVCSPGVPRTHPFRRRLDAAGTATTTLAAMWMQTAGSTTIGVTGTKGKSTTATVIDALLGAAGVDVQLGGNIGRPLADLRPDAQATVAELSSYQCAYLTVAPRVAVVTSLYEDHLPWHGSADQYWRDKARVFGEGCEVLICNDETLAKLRALDVPLPERVIVPGDALAERLGAVAAAGPFALAQNRNNLGLALLAVEFWLSRPLSDEELDRGVAAFRPLPHRLEVVAERNGVRWIDDTLSTVPESVIAAVDSIPGEILLILGGDDRGVDYGSLTAHLLARDPSPHVIAIPSNGDRIVEEYRRRHPDRVESAATVAAAVQRAAELARPGWAVVLSPGAPSHDFFRNFAHKSAVFVQAIRDLDG